MSRGGNYFYMVDLFREPGDAATLYVDKMYEDGLITERTFSFYFTLLGAHASYVDFGPIQGNAMKNTADIRYI